jgi:tetratricopeptide (TPR) repeat protein
MSKTRVPRRPAASRRENQQPASRRGHAWRLALLWVVLAGAYSNSFDAGLVFDNKPVIAEDPRIQAATARNAGLILHGDYWYRAPTSGLYRPLTTFSYLFNYAVLGNDANPPGYHAINLALHAGNATLVYFLGFEIFASPLMSLALAAMWGLHPLATEAVTNIVGRADLLAALGVLAGLLCHMKTRRWAGVAGIGIAQAVGIFSKENAIVLPALMVLYDFRCRPRKAWRVWPYASAALAIALFFAMRAATHPHFLINFQENPLSGAGFFAARLTAFKVIGKFLWLFVWPAALAADYSYNAVPLFGSGGWEDWKALLCVVICAAVLAAWAHSFKRSAPLFFFAGFFWIALLPTANLLLLIGAIMAERFLYLPMVGLCGCAVVGLKWLIEHRAPARAVWTGAAILCLALGARTYTRNMDWRDGLTLWTSAVEVNPNAARAHNNLGYELEQIPGRLPDAVAEYQTALRIRPDYPEAYYSLGNALLRMGRLPEAIAAFQSAVKYAPRFAEAHNNLGGALLQSGRFADAIGEFQAALRIQPDFAEARHNLASAHNQLGNALAQTAGRAGEAMAEYQAALRIEPGNAEAHANLGSAFYASGAMEQAIAEYRTALRLDPRLADAHFNLAQALLRTGKRSEAVGELQAADRIRPDAEIRRMLAELGAR